MLFYCHTEADSYFSTDCLEVEAGSANEAAERFGGGVFEDGADWAIPVEVIVAETRDGRHALRFRVTRTQIVTDEAREIGEVDIPAADSD